MGEVEKLELFFKDEQLELSPTEALLLKMELFLRMDSRNLALQKHYS